jgi:hypothetical protein
MSSPNEYHPSDGNSAAGTMSLDPEADSGVRVESIDETRPSASRLWIVWVVLGVIVVGIVIAVTVLALRFAAEYRAAEASSGQSAGGTSAEGRSGEFATADEEAAAGAVELYNEARLTPDCDAYLASTTGGFRFSIDIPDCDALATSDPKFVDSVEDFRTTVDGVEVADDDAVVWVTHTYSLPYDEEGNETETPVEHVVHGQYAVELSDGAWAVDDYEVVCGCAPSGTDEQMAIDTVTRYLEAWRVGDCEGYFASTTEGYQALLELTECGTFKETARGYSGTVDDLEVTIADVETVGSTIKVHLTETYTSAYDEEGNRTAEPAAYDNEFQYLLIHSPMGWEINDDFYE